MHLNSKAIEDILLWQDNVLAEKNSFALSNPRHSMTSDASGYGWGAVFKGTPTGGTFSAEEVDIHINVKELMACDFGLKALCGSLQDTHLKLLMDNTPAVCSINKMGSTKSMQLDARATKIWEWAINRDIHLSATHIPGIFNEEADEESRKGDQSFEWMLDPSVFSKICSLLAFDPEIDLFSSRLNYQIDKFVAFRPDPEASHIYAFSLD